MAQSQPTNNPHFSNLPQGSLTQQTQPPGQPTQQQTHVSYRNM